jgi:hypothetical protein
VLCGLASAASFDPLKGTTSGSGGSSADPVFVFTGAPVSASTFLVNEASPATDVNGSGFADGNEVARDENRAKVKITGTDGSVGSATFNPNCPGSTDNSEACIFLSGTMPAEMQPVQQNCTLPDGSSAANCMPIAIPAEAMYGTSINMTASVVISITSDTGTSVMRVRPPAGGGPVIGYVVTQNGGPVLVVKLDLYMDAPDLSLPLGATHDLHSKPLSVTLTGPVTTLDDGRISIAVKNTADVPLDVNINAPIVGAGTIHMVIPTGEMHLQLLSPALRGVLR